MRERPLNRVTSRASRRGYLLEVPLLLAAGGVAVALLFPALPPLGRNILLGAAAVPALFALYYLLVSPGWTPGSGGRLRPPWNWVAFGLVAGALLAAVLGAQP